MSRTLRTFAIPWLAALTLALATVAPCAAAGPSGELLLNPGFEDSLETHPWMPAAWDTSQTDLPTVFFGRDTFLTHGGRYAVSVANTSTLVPVWHNWSQTVLVGPETWGKDLVFSVWTRSNGLQGRAYIVLQAYRDTIGRMAKTWGIPRDLAGRRLGINKLDDPIIDLGWKRAYFSDPETDWVRREVRVFVPRSTNVIYARCGLVGTGQVVFDDASLKLEAARPAPAIPLRTNLLADPGFEGDGNDWEYSMPPYIGMRIDRDTTQAHSGKACIRYTSSIEGSVQARVGVCQVLGRGLAGKRVRISAWVKTDSLRGGRASLRLYCNSLSRGMVQSEPGQNFDLTNDWSPTSFEMDVPPDAVGTWAWFAYTVPATGTVYYDDASFEVLGPASTAAPTRTVAPPAAKKPAAPTTPAPAKKSAR
jgi:hypothetical protein